MSTPRRCHLSTLRPTPRPGGPGQSVVESLPLRADEHILPQADILFEARPARRSGPRRRSAEYGATACRRSPCRRSRRITISSCAPNSCVNACQRSGRSRATMIRDLPRPPVGRSCKAVLSSAIWSPRESDIENAVLESIMWCEMTTSGGAAATRSRPVPRERSRGGRSAGAGLRHLTLPENSSSQTSANSGRYFTRPVRPRRVPGVSSITMKSSSGTAYSQCSPLVWAGTKPKRG